MAGPGRRRDAHQRRIGAAARDRRFQRVPQHSAVDAAQPRQVGGSSSLLVGSPDTVASAIETYVAVAADLISLPSAGNLDGTTDTGRFVIRFVRGAARRHPGGRSQTEGPLTRWRLPENANGDALDLSQDLVGFVAGFVIATATRPVGCPGPSSCCRSRCRSWGPQPAGHAHQTCCTTKSRPRCSSSVSAPATARREAHRVAQQKGASRPHVTSSSGSPLLSRPWFRRLRVCAGACRRQRGRRGAEAAWGFAAGLVPGSVWCAGPGSG